MCDHREILDQKQANAQSCVYYVLRKLATPELITVLGLEMGIDVRIIQNCLYMYRDSMVEAIYDVHRWWVQESRPPFTHVDELGYLKQYMDVMDKGGMFKRVLGKYQIGYKENPMLDDACPKDWYEKMRDVEKIGLFLCRQTSVPEFQAILEALILNAPNDCLSEKCFRWIRKEEEDALNAKPWRRFEIFLDYLDMCKDSPDKILEIMYMSLCEKTEHGKELFKRTLQRFDLEEKYFFLMKTE